MGPMVSTRWNLNLIPVLVRYLLGLQDLSESIAGALIGITATHSKQSIIEDMTNLRLP